MTCAGLHGALPGTIDMTALTVLHITNTSMCFVANCSNPGDIQFFKTFATTLDSQAAHAFH